MKRAPTMLALAACSLALGGCQSLFGGPSFASRTPAPDSASIDMSDYFTARLAAGRAHLAQGRPTQAVTAFRQASYDPAHAARAYNGLGVAYAQLGRQDLAQRYFTMAVSADPQDERFARNLARLEQAPLGDVERAELAGAAAPPSQGASLDNRPRETPAAENSGLHRVSSREVQISSAEGLRSDRTVFVGQRQSSDAASSAAFAAAEPAQSHPVRVEFSRVAGPRKANYPVRIALSDVRVSQRTNYPIRIELSDPN